MPDLPERCCHNCEFFYDFGYEMLRENEDDDEAGQCRRYPPSVAVNNLVHLLMKGEQLLGSENFSFPDAKPRWWCGEFKKLQEFEPSEATE